MSLLAPVQETALWLTELRTGKIKLPLLAFVGWDGPSQMLGSLCNKPPLCSSAFHKCSQARCREDIVGQNGGAWVPIVPGMVGVNKKGFTLNSGNDDLSTVTQLKVGASTVGLAGGEPGGETQAVGSEAAYSAPHLPEKLRGSGWGLRKPPSVLSNIPWAFSMGPPPAWSCSAEGAEAANPKRVAVRVDRCWRSWDPRLRLVFLPAHKRTVGAAPCGSLSPDRATRAAVKPLKASEPAGLPARDLVKKSKFRVFYSTRPMPLENFSQARVPDKQREAGGEAGDQHSKPDWIVPLIGSGIGLPQGRGELGTESSGWQASRRREGQSPGPRSL